MDGENDRPVTGVGLVVVKVYAPDRLNVVDSGTLSDSPGLTVDPRPIVQVSTEGCVEIHDARVMHRLLRNGDFYYLGGPPWWARSSLAVVSAEPIRVSSRWCLAWDAPR